MSAPTPLAGAKARLQHWPEGWSGRAAAIVLGAWLLALPALAQERSPAERQELVDLARILGESHAISQACNGFADQTWRSRMHELLQAEAADQGLQDRLSLAFNASYASGQTLYPTCSEGAKAEARRVARAGETLAQALAKP